MPSPVRADFPALAELTYLNLGTHGLMPEPALQRYLQATASYEREGFFVHGELDVQREVARKRLAAMIGATPDTIALTGNANDGINLVAAGIAWQPGDEVLITDQEHPAVESPFGYLAERGLITLRRFPFGADAEEALANLEAALTPRTRLVAISTVSSQTGARIPEQAATTLAHARGAQILVDATQALGQVALDVAASNCDYLVSNGHKWLLGPKGTGLFYVRPDRLEELVPAHVGAGSLLDGTSTPTLQPTAARFEFGTRALPLWAGMNAALDWWEQRGVAPVWEHMRAMATLLKQRVLADPRLTLLTPQASEDSSAIVSFQVAGEPDSMALLKKLWEHKVLVRSVPEIRALRISCAPFIDERDFDRLFAALDAVTGSPS
jgi:selenocysteine lyase/cysteine desulfurase